MASSRVAWTMLTSGSGERRSTASNTICGEFAASNAMPAPARSSRPSSDTIRFVTVSSSPFIRAPSITLLSMLLITIAG